MQIVIPLLLDDRIHLSLVKVVIGIDHAIDLLLDWLAHSDWVGGTFFLLLSGIFDGSLNIELNFILNCVDVVSRLRSRAAEHGANIDTSIRIASRRNTFGRSITDLVDFAAVQLGLIKFTLNVDSVGSFFGLHP